MLRRNFRAQGARQRGGVPRIAIHRTAAVPDTLATAELSLFRKSQLLDAVLCERFILDARGKIIGERGARRLRVIDDQDPEEWLPDSLPPGRPWP